MVVSSFYLEPAQPRAGRRASFGPLRSAMDAYEKLEKIGEGVSCCAACCVTCVFVTCPILRTTWYLLYQVHRFESVICPHLHDGPRSFSA